MADGDLRPAPPVTGASALITGGATGIGRATATALRDAGFELTLVGRRSDVLEAAAAELGGTAVDAVDLADAGAPERIVAAHVERFGGIDALVTAAGAWELTASVDLTGAAWDRTLDVHLRGATLCASAAARHMRRAGHGRIVLISSVNGVQSEPDSIAYSAAKTAIISVARSLAVDLADSGVSVNAVAPGWVTTPMTAADLAATTPERMRRVNPLGRAGTPEEIANVIRYLVTDAPEFLTGATIMVDGGQTAMAALP